MILVRNIKYLPIVIRSCEIYYNGTHFGPAFGVIFFTADRKVMATILPSFLPEFLVDFDAIGQIDEILRPSPSFGGSGTRCMFVFGRVIID